MALRQRDESLAADWVKIRELTTAGESEQALQLVEQVVAKSPDPLRVAQALIQRLLAHYAAGETDALLPLLSEVEEQLRAAAHPRLILGDHAGALDVERAMLRLA